MAESKLTGSTAEDEVAAVDYPSGSAVYRWIGNYAQEFEGPADTVAFAAPGDYVEIDLAASPLAQEYFDGGLLIEAPGFTPGPAEANVTEEKAATKASTTTKK